MAPNNIMSSNLPAISQKIFFQERKKSKMNVSLNYPVIIINFNHYSFILTKKHKPQLQHLNDKEFLTS